MATKTQVSEPLRVELLLTPKQKAALASLQVEVDRAAAASKEGKDVRGAILGQVWVDEGYFYARWLNREQFEIVARALKRALKLNGTKTSTKKR